MDATKCCVILDIFKYNYVNDYIYGSRRRLETQRSQLSVKAYFQQKVAEFHDTVSRLAFDPTLPVGTQEEGE